MDNVCGSCPTNKMVLLIDAAVTNADLLMKELLAVMRSFYSVLDLENRLFFFLVLIVQNQTGTWAWLAVNTDSTHHLLKSIVI